MMVEFKLKNYNYGLLVKLLKSKGLTISTMESCTGGAVANKITNIEGASEVFEYSAVTYSNRAKMLMGVDEDVIKKYGVYSEATAYHMARKIKDFSKSYISIGITGRINTADKQNDYDKEYSKVYICMIYGAYDEDADVHLLNLKTKIKCIDVSCFDDRDWAKECICYDVAKLVIDTFSQKAGIVDMLHEYNRNCTYDIFSDTFVHRLTIGDEGIKTQEWYASQYADYLNDELDKATKKLIDRATSLVYDSDEGIKQLEFLP